MTEPQLHFVHCPDAHGGHRMAYWQWGNPQEAAQVLVCVHGLTRQGRDFDTLAQAVLAQSGPSVRVVCPDIAGRRPSDLAEDQAYQLGTYAADMLQLMAQLQASTVNWLGTGWADWHGGGGTA